MPKGAKIFLYSLGVFSKTMIGIGFFALPYAATKVGLPLFLIYLTALGVLVTLVHLMFAQLALKTPDYKRLVGFARVYLGRRAQFAVAGVNIIGLFGSLVAFIIIGGQFLSQLCQPVFGGSEIIYGTTYFAVGALLIYLGINLVQKIEFWGLALFLAIMVVLGSKAAPLITGANLATLTGKVGDIFFPYGPILFSFWASSSILEVEEMLGRANRKDLLKSVIIWSSVVAWLTYAIFTFIIIGISGANTSESALVGLRQILGDNVSSVLFLFGLITSFTTFVINGLALKKVFAYDLKINKNIAWLAVSIIPVALYLAGLTDFMLIFSLVGGVLLGVDGIFILLMYQKIRPDRKFVTLPLLLVFIGGIIYELAYWLK